jgi:hypothetical protein
MTRECHVRFCERLRGEFLRPTHQRDGRHTGRPPGGIGEHTVGPQYANPGEPAGEREGDDRSRASAAPTGGYADHPSGHQPHQREERDCGHGDPPSVPGRRRGLARLTA